MLSLLPMFLFQLTAGRKSYVHVTPAYYCSSNRVWVGRLRLFESKLNQKGVIVMNWNGRMEGHGAEQQRSIIITAVLQAFMTMTFFVSILTVEIVTPAYY